MKRNTVAMVLALLMWTTVALASSSLSVEDMQAIGGGCLSLGHCIDPYNCGLTGGGCSDFGCNEYIGCPNAVTYGQQVAWCVINGTPIDTTCSHPHACGWGWICACDMSAGPGYDLYRCIDFLEVGHIIPYRFCL